MKPDLKFWLFVIGMGIAFLAIIPLPKGILTPETTELLHYIAAGVYVMVHGAYGALVTGKATLPDPPINPLGRTQP